MAISILCGIVTALEILCNKGNCGRLFVALIKVCSQCRHGDSFNHICFSFDSSFTQGEKFTKVYIFDYCNTVYNVAQNIGLYM